ncbi:MAG: Kdo hydroxylase family protein [Sulfurifustaceae bacterium]
MAVQRFEISQWADEVPDPADQLRALEAIENGDLLLLPRLTFALLKTERRFLDAGISDGRSKNISYDPTTAELRGTCLQGRDRDQLYAMVERFSQQARRLIETLFPFYAPHLQWGRASFRPCEVDDRPSSYRKDDRRLHVDAFPSRPNRGQRILRVFSNVNPRRPRVWHIGEPFPAFAERFLPRVHPPLPGSAWLLERMGVTHGRRTDYDAIMLQLHDRAKADADYQRTGPQQEIVFPPGSTWIACTDQVLHAALSGQHLLEQTFQLEVEHMRHPERSPLRVLERLTGRRLQHVTPGPRAH